MKILKWFGIVLAGLIALLLIVALFLPSEATISVEKEVELAPGPVFHNLATFTDRNEWDPWLTMDPEAEVKISSTEKYVGSNYTWNGEVIGTGRMEVKYVNYPNRIESKIWFGNSPQPSDVTWDIVKSEKGAKLKWSFHSQGSYPFGRYMLLLMKGPLLSSFETGLGQLKEYIESHPPRLYELSEITIERSYDTWAMVYPATVEVSDMQDELMEAFPALLQVIQEQGLELNGPAFIHYTDFEPVKGISNVFFACPVKTRGSAQALIKPEFYKAIEAVSATHTGEYTYFQESYSLLQKYIDEHQIEVTGEAFEVYLSTMMDSENPMEWKTMIAFPIKK